MSELTHLDQSGAAHMVDVSGKAITARQAIAHGRLSMSVEARDAIAQGLTKKGDVLADARVAGIMGAKKTSELLPETEEDSGGQESVRTARTALATDHRNK